MTTILNLTQHPATTDQQAAGVIDLPEVMREALQNLLTFEALPTAAEVRARAAAIAAIAQLDGAEAAMIGGAPYLMGPLERALEQVGILPLYAFSRRESVEQVQPDGSVRKATVFRHAGFVEAAV